MTIVARFGDIKTLCTLVEFGYYHIVVLQDFVGGMYASCS